MRRSLVFTCLFASTAIAISASSSTISTNSTTSSSPCVPSTGVHIVVARASTEPPGTGIIGAIASQVAQMYTGSNIVAVDYPAALSPYVPSETAGVSAMSGLVNDYAAKCPGGRIVMMGYSQGAQVAADVICGASEATFPATQALSANVANSIAAVVLMGDPSHAKNQSFAQGTSTNQGLFPRQDSAACGAVASRMVSFCNSGDEFCDSGNSLQVHLSYVQTNGDDAVKFVQQQLGGGTGVGSSSTGERGSGGGKTSSTAFLPTTTTEVPQVATDTAEGGASTSATTKTRGGGSATATGRASATATTTATGRSRPSSSPVTPASTTTSGAGSNGTTPVVTGGAWHLSLPYQATTVALSMVICVSCLLL